VKQRITTLFASGVLALAPFGVARAGPFEDAQAADQKGDHATELQILRPLAEQGNALAQLGLGVMYASGQGVPQDYAQAVVWYRKAAEQGDADAQTLVGLMYAQRPRRAAGLRAGPHLLSQGRRARGRPRAVKPRLDVRQGPRRAAGLCSRSYVVQHCSRSRRRIGCLGSRFGQVARPCCNPYDSRSDRRGAADGERVEAEVRPRSF
jgi:TPR repeat protein